MNVILGGGIAGLIWGYYHEDHFILTDQVGGQMMSYFDLGPRYLHNSSDYVQDFLLSLKIPIQPRIIKIGYLDNTGWVKNPDLKFRQQYYMKSRGVNDISGFDPSVLNTNISEFTVCDVDFKELISKLSIRLTHRIYTSKVTSIDLKERLITTSTNNMTIKFDKLVSTIPLNIFSRIAGLGLDLKSTSMIYCLLSNDFFDLEVFDYVYDARTTTSFHRMTKCKQGVVCDVLSSKKQQFLHDLPAKYFHVSIEDSMVEVKNNQIISLEKDFELKDKSIKFVGRYGAWNRKWKTETVIEEAQKHGRY